MLQIHHEAMLVGFVYLIDPSHKSHSASDKYPTMHHFVKQMCTHLHISVTKWCIVGYGTDALWDIWDWSIAKPHTCQGRYGNCSYTEECNFIITGSDWGSLPVGRMTPNLTMLCSWYPYFHRKWLLLDYWVTKFWSESGRDWLHQQF